MAPRKPATTQEVVDALSSVSQQRDAYRWNAAIGTLRRKLHTTTIRAEAWLRAAAIEKDGPLVCVAGGTLVEFRRDGEWHSVGDYLNLYFTPEGLRVKKMPENSGLIYVLLRTRFDELCAEMRAEAKAEVALRKEEKRAKQAIVHGHHAEDIELITAFLSTIDQPGVDPSWAETMPMYESRVSGLDRTAARFGDPVQFEIRLRGGQITGFAAKLRTLMVGSIDGDMLADVIAESAPREWTAEAAQALAETVLIGMHKAGATILRGMGSQPWAPEDAGADLPRVGNPYPLT